VIRVSHDTVSPATGREYAGTAHQAMDSLAGAAKFGMEHMVQAVKAKRRVLCVKLDELARNRLILKRTGAGLVMFPCVIAAPGDFKYAA
jgi:hypothetical protein